MSKNVVNFLGLERVLNQSFNTWRGTKNFALPVFYTVHSTWFWIKSCDKIRLSENSYFHNF